MKDLPNLLFTAAVAFTLFFLCFVGGGVLLTWYVESRWGVEGVEKALNLMGWIGAFLTAATVIGFGWFLANRSHVEGARTANQAQENSAAVLGEMFAALTAAQKADASMAKAYAAQAGADAQIRVLNHKAELSAQQRGLLAAPEAEPVRRAPWEASASANDDNATDGRFRVMY